MVKNILMNFKPSGVQNGKVTEAEAMHLVHGAPSTAGLCL